MSNLNYNGKDNYSNSLKKGSSNNNNKSIHRG
jgi:hypothetical protein